MSSNHPQLGSQPLHELTEFVEQEFLARFSRSPSIIVAAPGRVNLIGEHIDYNDGFVLPMAIERYVIIAASLADDQNAPTANLYSVGMQEVVTVPLDSKIEPGFEGWGNYVAGVLAGFQDRDTKIPAFEAVIHSNVPLGGGLSSSAALEVATATLLETITHTTLSKRDKALLCQQAEHRFAGVPCGIMDQFSSVFGRTNELMRIDCRSQEVQSVVFAADDITVVITNSNVKHELTGGEYALRRSQCDSALKKLKQSSWRKVTNELLEASKNLLSPTEYCRSRHVVSEISRTTAVATAFQSGNDWSRIGELMYDSHASLRDDFEVSCKELDLLVDLAREIGKPGGVLGTRMTGGGFGGCTVSLVKQADVRAFIHTLATRYEAEIGIHPDSFASRPARGAHVIRGKAVTYSELRHH